MAGDGADTGGGAAAGEREFPRASVESHNTREDLLIIIDNVVYDVGQFLNDHPGGADVLLDNGGRDASRCFRDVGHSDTALEWRKKFRVGVVPERERWPELGRTLPPLDAVPEPESTAALLAAAAPPLALAFIAVLVYYYLF